MKEHIDTVYKDILHDLAQETPSDPVLSIYYVAAGIDGISKARLRRRALEAWSVDPFLTADDRDYARARLESLPCF